MKINITMKTPDALDYAIKDALEFSTLSNDDKIDQTDTIKQLANTWFNYGEYVTLEIDTDTKTCIVVPK